MPIQYNKKAFTLQEKIDKAFQLTYHIHNIAEAQFMRNFLIELIEKGYTKLPTIFTQDKVDKPDPSIIDKIEQLKRTME